MREVTLLGNLVADPKEVKYKKKGEKEKKSMTFFTVAVNAGEESVFVKCRAFGMIAETISNYFKKGSRIFCQGFLSTKTIQDEESETYYDTYDIVINHFEFCEKSNSTKSKSKKKASDEEEDDE